MNDYPQWKIIVWRFTRVFLATFLLLFGSALQATDDWAVSSLYAMLLSTIPAALNATWKAARDNIADNYDHWLHKVPF